MPPDPERKPRDPAIMGIGARMTDAEAEFHALSRKVSARKATPEEVARWRALRSQLAKPPPPPPSPRPGPRRAHVRSSRKLRVQYAPVKELQVTFTDEIGAGGLRIVSPEHLEPGAELVLRLELGGATATEPMVVAGRVAWSRREGGHFQVGVELPELRPDDRERLEAWVHDGERSARSP